MIRLKYSSCRNISIDGFRLSIVIIFTMIIITVIIIWIQYHVHSLYSLHSFGTYMHATQAAAAAFVVVRVFYLVAGGVDKARSRATCVTNLAACDRAVAVST